MHTASTVGNRNVTQKSLPPTFSGLCDMDAVTRRVVTGLYPGVTTVELDNLAAETLERSYLLKLHGQVHERPQHMLMRVSVGIHKDDIDSAIETYNLMSKKWFTHASPTLFNSGTPRPQMSSCFLLTMKDDSIEGIYDTLKECAIISKNAGGIGLNVHNIRSAGTYIAGTNGDSNGLVPMLRVFNNTARYVDQGGNKRPGAFAIYLEPWHPDILQFVEMRKNTGAEEIRARDLFYALWIPDLFMRRVETNEHWTLMDPHECPGLPDTWGEEFEALYLKYEKEGRGRRTLRAQEVWHAIIEAQIETGTPFMLYKDSCNKKSNHQHLGTIRCSNLCTEIVEYSSPDETAVCNLASISLPHFVNPEERVFDFDQLQYVTRVVTRNLNRVIDNSYYPVEEARRSNMRHRPIGIGVQGLADAFLLMRYAFDGPEAAALNKRIFETIYFAALDASCKLAEEYGPFETYEGCPVSKGILQPDMWGVDTEELSKISGLDWSGLRQRIKQYGVRNSLLLAPMPTASTAQILGNNESFEPFTSNVYSRRVLSGEFQIVNPYLLDDLTRLGLWSEDLKSAIVANQGSIQDIQGIPEDLKPLYKTGLKTGMYYLRTRPAAEPIKFTVDKTSVRALLERGIVKNGMNGHAIDEAQEAAEEECILQEIQRRNKEAIACSLNNPEAPMPTASTAQILGNNESFEPFTSNVYSRRVLSGEFQIVNPYLLDDLTRLGLWSEDLKSAIVANQGSIQDIQGIPEDLKPLYKTVWEISQKKIIDMAADRGPFIDQSHSLNLHMAQPNYGKMTSMHFYAWKKATAEPIKFTVDKTSVRALLERGIVKNGMNGHAIDEAQEAAEEECILQEIQRRNKEAIACSLNNPEGCLSCQG
ncbi:hypothetical protein AHF37_02598 [Paragonimus kellicotti]|nr:hypothetical protein AHF37_02598 [Paragonimus kellicotti]